MKTAKQIFGLMQGVWNFKRSVIHKAPMQESYEGAGYAVFSLLKEPENELKYHENVELNNLQTGIAIKGYKTYKYIYISKTAEIVKYFDDGNLFYKLNISGQDCVGDYLCALDHYNATYNFNNDDNFSLRYEVKGPKKDYILYTEYTRAI